MNFKYIHKIHSLREILIPKINSLYTLYFSLAVLYHLHHPSSLNTLSHVYLPHSKSTISTYFKSLKKKVHPLVALVVKNQPANAGDLRDVDLIPEWGRSLGEKHGNLLQYSCVENPMDRGAHGIPSTAPQRVGHD